MAYYIVVTSIDNFIDKPYIERIRLLEMQQHDLFKNGYSKTKKNEVDIIESRIWNIENYVLRTSNRNWGGWITILVFFSIIFYVVTNKNFLNGFFGSPNPSRIPDGIKRRMK